MFSDMPEAECRFFKSRRGNKMLIVDNIRYRINSVNLHKVRWRCCSHERFGCKSKVHTIGNKIVFITTEHITSLPTKDD